MKERGVPSEVEVSDDCSGSEVKVLHNDGHDLNVSAA